MKRLVGNVLAGSMLALSLSGCGAVKDAFDNKEVYDGEHTDIKPAVAVITPEQADRYRKTYDDITAFWKGSATAKLVLLNGSDKRDCAKTGARTYMVTARFSPQYCPLNDEVVMTGGFAAVKNSAYTHGDPALMLAGERVALAHEYGHGIQHSQGYTIGPDDEKFIKAVELGADCFAGVYMGQSKLYSQAEIDAGAAFLRVTPVGDGSHGTPEDRAASYHEGAETGSCITVAQRIATFS